MRKILFILLVIPLFAFAGGLSLVTGDAAPEIDVPSASAIYLIVTPQLTLSLTSSHIAGKNYDVFEIDNGGVDVLCSGPAWLSNTIRSLDVERVGDKIVNSSVMTCINGATSYSVPAHAGNLRGGFRAYANGLTRSTKQSRLVWDAYYPTLLPVAALETASTWSYGAAAFRQVNANPSNQIEVFNGMSGRPVDVTASGYMIGTGGLTSGFIGIGLDTSVADSSMVKNPCAGGNTFPVLPCWARFVGYTGIGYHELRIIERGSGSAITWVGTNGYGGVGYQTGLIGFVLQ